MHWEARQPMRTTRKQPIVAGKKAVQDKIPGINRVVAKLANGSEAVYYYHRATGTKLPGAYGSKEFLDALAAARDGSPKHTDGTLAGLIRSFEGTAKWRKLADSTKKEYRRVFKFWDGKFGTLPIKAVASKAFRQDVLEWHDAFSADKPREADNRVTILARVLSWAASDRSLTANVLDSFDRAYSSDRSELIWLPEHIDAFLEKADSEMQLALILALHTGQRQADIRRMAWSNYDGQRITVRQGKSRRDGKPGRLIIIRCTAALKATLDGMERRGALILTTKTGRAFQKRYFARKWEATATAAGIVGLHFHDLRGTTVTMLFEAGCNVAEAAAITGHTLKTAEAILDKYLSRTGSLAETAILKFENRMNTEHAKRAAKRPLME
jgi:integrase